jgi:hypothetical protein
MKSGRGEQRVDRNKFIDDLISAGADDSEIAEALQLAEERGDLVAASPAPTPPQKRVLPPSFGTPGTYTAPNVDVGPSYSERVNADIDQQAQKDVVRQQQGGSKNLSEIGAKMQSMAAPIRQAPGLHELGQAAGGAFQKILPGAVPVIGKAVNYFNEKAPPNIRSLADIVGGAAEVIPAAEGGYKLLSGASKEAWSGAMSYKKSSKTMRLDADIKAGFDKGVKPTVKNKSSYSKMKEFDAQGNKAVRIMAENQDKIKLVDEFGEQIPYPRNAAEMAQAIEKNKEYIFKQYDAMAKSAGAGGVKFSTDNLQRKLDDIIRNIGNPDEVVNHAYRLKKELEKLHGASPEAIQQRIKYYNKTLEGYYAGRSVSQAKAQVEGSVANALREDLDDMITSAAGEGYSELKRQYGSLKAIESEVNHRAIVNARKSAKGIADITDIFTGGDLIAGALSQNPALFVRGIAGQMIKKEIKRANNPEKYIERMFKNAYKTYKLSDYGR